MPLIFVPNIIEVYSQHGETKSSNGTVVARFASFGVEILLFMKQELNVYCRHPNEMPLYYKRNLKLHMKLLINIVFMTFFLFPGGHVLFPYLNKKRNID